MQIEGLAAVTGAGQGIGLGVTQALARRGVDVLALVLEDSMRSAVHEAVSGAPGSVRTAVLDVTDLGDFAFPDDLQVIVNNAGIRHRYLPVEVSEPYEWHDLFAVNFFGLVEVTRRAIPVLRVGGGGVICNVSSGSLLSAIPFLAPYRASKAAVSALCETLRIELAPFGIRVVEIMPGATRTAMNDDSMLHRVADAVDFPPYAPMAEAQFELNREFSDVTSIEDVGEAIVDAIVDDDGPMRSGTDATSRLLLERWRSTSDEEQMLDVLARLAPRVLP